MKEDLRNLDVARTEVSASSAGGAPFLICFGLTLLVAGILYFFLPLRTAALVAMFQGCIALPMAFWLERRMGDGRMSADNPLRALSVQMAMSQGVALPAVIVAFSLKPHTVPVVLAAIGGGHFLPYAWLQRTNIYFGLGVAVSLGAFAIQVLIGPPAFPYVLFYLCLIYWASAPIIFRHAKRLVREATK